MHEVEVLLRQLLQCRTENPPGDESSAAAVLEAYFAQRNVPVRRSEVHAGRPNVYARAGTGSPTVLLNGHTDTVPAGVGWSHDPFAGEVVGDRIYGRGACDMKGGLAACAVTTAKLAERGQLLRGSVLFAAVVDEELGATGAKHAVAIDRLSAQAAIVAEPTRLRVVPSTNGQLNFAVRLLGRAAHSSAAHTGHSAITDAWRLMSYLEPAKRPYLIGTIQGGDAPNIVPAACQLMIDRRVNPEETLEEVEDEFAQALAQATAAAPAPGTYEITLAVPPLSPESGHLVQDAVAQVAGTGPPFEHYAAATDASWFAAAGIPTVLFGPGDPGVAHLPDEYVSLSDVARAAFTLEAAVRHIIEMMGHG